MIRAFIMWMVRRSDPIHCRHPLTVVMWKPNVNPKRRIANQRKGVRKVVARRYMPFFKDEIQRGDDSIYLRLPWWTPFNVLLHHWVKHEDELMHDHPRWSATICLRGELVEKTPWGERRLRAGSIVWRKASFIHGFKVEPEHSARTWTLFIVGRRCHPQNTYEVTRRTEAADRKSA